MTNTPPADLVRLRRRFDAAGIACTRLAARAATNDQRAALARLYGWRMDLLDAVHRHAWWSQVSDRQAARRALVDAVEAA